MVLPVSGEAEESLDSSTWGREWESGVAERDGQGLPVHVAFRVEPWCVEPLEVAKLGELFVVTCDVRQPVFGERTVPCQQRLLHKLHGV
jgi:hypothetical protein